MFITLNRCISLVSVCNASSSSRIHGHCMRRRRAGRERTEGVETRIRRVGVRENGRGEGRIGKVGTEEIRRGKYGHSGADERSGVPLRRTRAKAACGCRLRATVMENGVGERGGSHGACSPPRVLPHGRVVGDGLSRAGERDRAERLARPCGMVWRWARTGCLDTERKGTVGSKRERRGAGRHRECMGRNSSE